MAGNGVGADFFDKVFSTTLHPISVSYPLSWHSPPGDGTVFNTSYDNVRDGIGIIRPFAFAVKPAFPDIPDTMETDSESSAVRITYVALIERQVDGIFKIL